MTSGGEPLDYIHAAVYERAVRVGMTQGRGRGLFSTRVLAAGDTCLIESPLAAMQSLENAHDVMVCRNCLGFVGDVISQLELLSGMPRHECLQRMCDRKASNEEPQDTLVFSPVVECSQGCGEVYCSEDCRQQHFERCHHLLCVGPIPAEEAPSHPLVQFRIHAAETNEIFLLVGEVVARIISSYMKNGNNVEDAEAPFADFVRGAWWDVVIAREDGPRSHKGATATSQEVGTLPQTLRDLCEQSSSLLRKALGVPSTLERVISTERFGTIIGMFEQNNVGIRVPPLISQALISMLEGEENVAKGIVHNVTTRLAELLADIDEEAECSDAENCVGEEGDESEDCDSTSVADEEREESCVAFDEAMNILHKVLPCEKELFPPLDGTALYTLICCMNHSCSPNCSIEYSGKTSDMIEKKADQMIARVVLLENVTEGEELTQSYIDTQLGLEERRRALEEYGFWCRCKRCVQEEGEWEENNTKAR